MDEISNRSLRSKVEIERKDEVSRVFSLSLIEQNLITNTDRSIIVSHFVTDYLLQNERYGMSHAIFV
jgi:hypothetical protein